MINNECLTTLKLKSDCEIYIYGAGSFGEKVKKVVIKNEIEIKGFIDSNYQKVGSFFCDSRIFSLDEVLKIDNSFIIIASMYFNEIENLLKSKQYDHYYVIYPQTLNLIRLSENDKKKFIEFKNDVIFGENCSMRLDVINETGSKVSIGQKSFLDCNFIFESSKGQVLIGDNTYIGSSTNLISREKITVGNNVTISWGCYIYDHDSHSINYMERRNDFEKYREDYLRFGNPILNKRWDTVKSKEIIIEDDVWIGFEVTILKGVKIGEGAIIGAKSVVTKDVPPWSVVAGNPAEVVKFLDEE